MTLLVVAKTVAAVGLITQGDNHGCNCEGGAPLKHEAQTVGTQGILHAARLGCSSSFDDHA